MSNQGLAMQNPGAINLNQLTQQQIEAMAMGAANKLNVIKTELNQVVLEREAEISSLIRALAASEHVLFLGPPGVAKTMLARYMVSHIVDGRYFYWLMNRTTDPSALLGPYKLKEMEKGRFTRNWQGMLPDCHIVNLDEFYKSNEPVVNILLTILNERLFHDDGQAIPVVLRTLVACSNEGPEDDILKPLHDRLLFRHIVQPIKDPSNRIKMMKLDVARRSVGGQYIPRTVISIPELDALSIVINRWVKIPDSVYAALNKLDMALIKKGIEITDRRKTARMKVLQAEAVLNGRMIVSTNDLTALTHIFWEREEDIKEVDTEISKLVNPYEQKFKELMTRATEIHKVTMGIDTFAERAKAAIEAKSVLDKILEKMSGMTDSMRKEGHDTDKIQKGIVEVESFRSQVMQDCLGVNKATNNAQVIDQPDLFGTNGSDASLPF